MPTCPQFVGIRGMDSKRRLLGFFGAKNHKNLVLRVVDVLELRIESLFEVVKWVCVSREVAIFTDAGRGSMKTAFLRQYPNGFITLPIEPLIDPMTLKEVEVVQQVIAEYRNIRLGKGEPSRTDLCKECGGTGFGLGPEGKCENCDGTGKIVTFLEMSDEETKLAEGKQQ
jgi:hypothetical protein